MAIGDDWTDEDLFAVLPPTAYSIRVAPRISKARFNVKSVQDVRSLIEKLAALTSDTISSGDVRARGFYKGEALEKT